MTLDVHSDAVAAYEVAAERARLVQEAWDELGRPVMAEGGATGRAPVPHPLLRAMAEADTVADRLREKVRKAHRGPAPGAVLRGGVGESGSAKLRLARAEQKAG